MTRTAECPRCKGWFWLVLDRYLPQHDEREVMRFCRGSGTAV